MSPILPAVRRQMQGCQSHLVDADLWGHMHVHICNTIPPFQYALLAVADDELEKGVKAAPEAQLSCNQALNGS